MYSTSNEKERLDRIASWYTNRTGISAMSGRVCAQYIKQYANPGSAMLEMGCGKGLVTEILAEAFPGLEVVDGAETNVAMVKGFLGDKVVVYHSLFEEFEPTHKYDDIVMGRILGHIRDPVLLLRRAIRWLNPKGKIHIVVPNAESVHRRIGVAMGILKTVHSQSNNDVAVGQVIVFDTKSLQSTVERAGMKVTHLHGTLLKPLSSEQMEGWSEELLSACYEVAKDLPPELTAELYACCEKE